MYIKKEKGVDLREMSDICEPTKMLTIREVAKTGILTEHALRLMVKQQKIPAVFIGRRSYINFELLKKILGSNTTLIINTKKQEEKDAKKKISKKV